MSVKKNLTVAALGALLAVPAFGATNAPHILNMPLVTAHADSGPESYFPAGTHWTYNWDPLHTGHRGVDPYDQTTINGYTFDTDNGQYILNGHIVSYNQWLAGLRQAENNNSSQQDNSNNTYNNDTNSDSSTQYTSKNNLPQTSEVNNQVKRIAASIILGATAVGTGATAFELKKHNRKNNDINTYKDTAISGNDNNNKISNIVNKLRIETNKLENVTNQIVNE